MAPDRPGLFSRVAGVLSIHGLDVLGAQAHSDEQGMAANEFRVAPPRDGVIDWTRVAGDLERAIAGQLAIEARLAERARTYRRRRALAAAAVRTSVRIDNDASSNATVVEVRAPDRVGLLYRITKAIADLGLDIRHARVQTLGPEVVDTFYVRYADGKVIDAVHLGRAGAGAAARRRPPPRREAARTGAAGARLGRVPTWPWRRELSTPTPPPPSTSPGI